MEKLGGLIDGAPEPMLVAGECDDALVEIPCIATNRRAASDPVGEFPTKLLGPAADSFIADDDSLRRRHFLDHPRAWREPKIRSNRVDDRLGLEATAALSRSASMVHDEI